MISEIKLKVKSSRISVKVRIKKLIIILIKKTNYSGILFVF